MYRLNQVSLFESKTLDVGLSNTSHIKSTVDLHHVLSSFCAALSHTSVWYKRFIRTTPDYNCFALHHLIGVIAPQVITVIVFLRVRYAKQKGGNEKKTPLRGVFSGQSFWLFFFLITAGIHSLISPPTVAAVEVKNDFSIVSQQQ